ncbi:flavin-dependent oxidoreductase [Amycolatopsis sp. NPDC005232]|uniref:flavin-dependent oxidoreductase n=1 Tax=Amycolatopsis sp. NPDC005232 TaxID=3157027 RepID=UPI0033AA54FE
MSEVVIIGGGIGGLTLALELHAAGVDCTVHEAVDELSAVGVGINLLPHATRELTRLGLADELSAVAIETENSLYFNRFGQRIYTEKTGRTAGYPWPQFSIHRGDLHDILVRAVRDRLGPDRLLTGRRCVAVSQDATGATAEFEQGSVRAAVVVGCDGVNSVVRRQLHPDQSGPVYSGYNMWRGVTPWPAILGGASMIRAGWLATGKLVVYPIRNHVDDEGRQLVNWVVEIETPQHADRDWNRTGRLEDFLPAFADWHFDWLDVPALLSSSTTILEYPMVDQEPLASWGTGRITLLGDAAHPMVPRGSNGAGQSILDARALATQLTATSDVVAALSAYEVERLPATAAVVRANRTTPPDAILREVYERTGDRPFDRLENVVDPRELEAILTSYKEIAGYSLTELSARH